MISYCLSGLIKYPYPFPLQSRHHQLNKSPKVTTVVVTQAHTEERQSEGEEEETCGNMSGLATLPPPKNWNPVAHNSPTNQSNGNHTKTFQIHLGTTKKVSPLSCFALNPSKNSNQAVEKEARPPLVVVGSANADIYVEIDRLPKEGETVSAKTGQTLAGGKGANQAVCGGKLAYPTYFVGQVGEDAHGRLISEALEGGGVRIDYLTSVSNAPTGHAVVMLQPDGQNSIIIVGGANMSCWPNNLSDENLEIVRNAGILLLQREIPDSVNIQVAKVGFFFLKFGILFAVLIAMCEFAMK